MAAPQIISIAPQQKSNGIGDYVFKGALIVGGFFIGRKFYRDWKKNKTEDAAGNDPNAQLAMEIHQAIDGAGTSEKVLFDVANRITDWAAVSKAYRNLYNANMTDDIKGDLSASDYQRFLNLYNLGQKNPDGSPKNSKNLIEPGLLVTTEKEAYIRKSPVYMKVPTGLIKAIDQLQPINLIKSNAIALAPAGKVVGITTGIYSDDTKSPSATRYLQVDVAMVDSKLKISRVKVWIASSQVKTKKVTAEQIKAVKVTDQVILKENFYKNALSGVGQNYGQVKVITKGSLVGVYDENLVLIDYVQKPGVILGYKVGETEKETAKMLTYQTVDGRIRNSFVEQVETETELYNDYL